MNYAHTVKDKNAKHIERRPSQALYIQSESKKKTPTILNIERPYQAINTRSLKDKYAN